MSRFLSCELCGRVKDFKDAWFKGQATEKMVTIRVPCSDGQGEDASCNICGEQCAAEYVAVWVNEQQHRSEHDAQA